MEPRHGKFMSFLDAALLVLNEVERPMTHNDMCKQLVDRQLIDSRGKTPLQTLNSSLNQNIARRGKDSIFFKHAPGVYGLRKHELRDHPYVEDIVADAKRRKEAGTLPFACDRDRSGSRNRSKAKRRHRKKARTKRRLEVDTEEEEESERSRSSFSAPSRSEPLSSSGGSKRSKRVRQTRRFQDLETVIEEEEGSMYEYSSVGGGGKRASPMRVARPTSQGEEMVPVAGKAPRTPPTVYPWISWGAVTPEARIQLAAHQRGLVGGLEDVDAFFGKDSLLLRVEWDTILNEQNFTELLTPEEQWKLMELLPTVDVESAVKKIQTENGTMRLELSERRLPLRLSCGPPYQYSQDGRVRLVPTGVSQLDSVKVNPAVFQWKQVEKAQEELRELLALGWFDPDRAEWIGERITRFPPWMQEQWRHLQTKDGMGLNVLDMVERIRTGRKENAEERQRRWGRSNSTLGELAAAAVLQQQCEDEWSEEGGLGSSLKAATAANGFMSLSPEKRRGIGPERVVSPKAIPSPRKGLTFRELGSSSEGGSLHVVDGSLGWPADPGHTEDVTVPKRWTPNHEREEVRKVCWMMEKKRRRVQVQVGGRWEESQQAASMEAALMTFHSSGGGSGMAQRPPSSAWRTPSPAMLRVGFGSTCPLCYRSGGCDCDQRALSPSARNFQTPRSHSSVGSSGGRVIALSPVNTSGLRSPTSPWTVHGVFSTHGASAEGVRVRGPAQTFANPTTPYSYGESSATEDVTRFLAAKLSKSPKEGGR